MAVAAWRPDLYFGVPFNADPNDPNAVPSWSELTARFRGARGVSRGRQYELDQNQTGQPTIVLDDLDEDLNPANTASPYYPNVVPYRQCVLQAMWPNSGTGNLLNSLSGYDPTFESYAPGSVPTWVTAVGGTSPTVLTEPI